MDVNEFGAANSASEVEFEVDGEEFQHSYEFHHTPEIGMDGGEHRSGEEGEQPASASLYNGGDYNGGIKTGR